MIQILFDESNAVEECGDLLCFPPLIIDAVNRRVTLNEYIVPLTFNEMEILLLLARTPGKIFSAGEIYREIWKQPDLNVVTTVRMHVSRMRKKLESVCPACSFVKTLWGQGYLFNEKP